MAEQENGCELDIENLLEKLGREKCYTRKEVYQQEVAKYLKSKLAVYDLPTHELMEIVQYVTVGTLLVANAEVEAAYKLWRNDLKKSTRPLRRQFSNNDTTTNNES